MFLFAWRLDDNLSFAHLTGDQSIKVENIRYIIPHSHKRHPRMHSSLQINGDQHPLQIYSIQL
jgi:hypothetical protein